MGQSWELGVALAVLGASLISLGLNVQKLSVLKNGALPAEQQRLYYRQCLWQAGFSLFLLGNVLNFLAMGFAPASVLAPLGSVSIAANAVFARLILGEVFTCHDFIATFIIMVGAVIVVCCSPDGDPPALEPLEMLLLWIKPLFAAWFCACGACCIVVHRRYIRDNMDLVEKDCKASSDSNHGETALAFSYISALYGCLAFLCSKSIAELYKEAASVTTANIIPSVVLLAGLARGATQQVHWLNRGLNASNALLVLPAYYAFGIVLQVTSGMIFFSESPSQPLWFLFGLATTLAGVYQLALRTVGDNADDDSDLEMSNIPVDDYQELSLSGQQTLRERSRSAPALIASPLPHLRTFPLLSSHQPALPRRMFSMHASAHADSFGQQSGKERSYTVAFVGFGVS
eukprot:TRINITY_DN113091_c0_g1_i1.p1 TRINITY_DN113091_c0_g1~~TRINITY_DN113091_c0_g1_i1.p1  ORF type:complete len:402 (+),score=41.25 TRINITY_DN113091_c0_g1_i1:87-1292(+)